MALLLVLFVVNLIAFPGFFRIEIKDGHLFGSLIDILRNGAPTLIVAIGMTLVIATRGIDLSVGAVGAIAGALACSIILDSPDPGSVTTVITAVVVSLLVAVVLGLWNGALVAVIGIQPIVATLILMTAGRGIAMLITEGQILTVNSASVQGDRFRLPARHPGGGGGRRGDLPRRRAADPPDRARHADRVHRRQPGGEPTGRASALASCSSPCTSSALCAPASPDSSSPLTRRRRMRTTRVCSSSSTRSSPS